MSLTLLRSIFEEIPNNKEWSIQLLRITGGKRKGMQYTSAEIFLTQLAEFISDVSRVNTMEDCQLERYEGVIEYDGTASSNFVYKISPSNHLVKEELDRLITAVAYPEREADALNYTAQAYLLKGVVKIQGEEMPVKLISIQNPITTLKHKYLVNNGSFTQISSKVLSLRTYMDVIILDRAIYFLTLAGEKLFGMERAYRKVCLIKVDLLESSGIVSDIDAFKKVAIAGHNPRRFLTFKDAKLAAMQDPQKNSAIAEKFGLTISDGKFDTSVAGASEKIIKLLCSKGMLDPFEDTPVEVIGAKQWQ